MDTFVNRLLQTMLIEKQNKINSGVYALTQREFAYNSNKIEGSRLTKEHTSSLFDTGSIYAEGEYRAKDIEEATGHFVMFNAMLDTINSPLTEELIKYFHKCLKQGVFEDIANGYAIGDYKTRANFVGDIETVHPSMVHDEMINLITSYTKSNKSLHEIAEFHVKYEKIHPFQDGNLSKDFHKSPYGKQIIMESKSYFTLFLKIIQGFTFHKIFIYSLSS